MSSSERELGGRGLRSGSGLAACAPVPSGGVRSGSVCCNAGPAGRASACTAGVGKWGARGRSVAVFAVGVCHCSARVAAAEACRSPKNACKSASCAVAGMYHPGCWDKVTAHGKWMSAPGGCCSPADLRVSGRVRSPGGSICPVSWATCWRTVRMWCRCCQGMGCARSSCSTSRCHCAPVFQAVRPVVLGQVVRVALAVLRGRGGACCGGRLGRCRLLLLQCWSGRCGIPCLLWWRDALRHALPDLGRGCVGGADPSSLSCVQIDCQSPGAVLGAARLW